MEQRKEIYKVGDVVYWLSNFICHKGIIKEINRNDYYPIIVEFETISSLIEFTVDGRFYDSDISPSLSFAPYDIVNGGFTQERPLPIIEVDTLVYYKDTFDSNNVWKMGYFYEYSGKDMYVFPYQRKSTDYENGVHKKTGDIIGFKSFPISEWSLTNPLESNG